jgi:AcrR family transcriptional regulator
MVHREGDRVDGGPAEHLTADRCLFYADRAVSQMIETVTKEQVVGEFRCRSIREAAMRVVGRKGLANATVQEIANEAGVAKGTVYLYFRSREEIIEKTNQIAVDDLLDRTLEAIKAGGPVRDVLERVLTTQIGYFDEHQDFFRLYFAMVDGSEESRRRRLANRRRQVAQLVMMLEAASKAGEIRAADPERVAVAIAGAVREVIFRRVDGRSTHTTEDEVRFLTDLFCDGLCVRRGRRG